MLDTKPAPKDWKAAFLAEQVAAEARGFKTPPAMLAEFKAEISLLDLDGPIESDVVAPIVSASAVDLDE